MRVGKKAPNKIQDHDNWVEIAQTASKPIQIEKSQLILNADYSFGKSGKFDGSNSYLQLADSNDWNLLGDTTSNKTWEFWVKVNNDTNYAMLFSQNANGGNDSLRIWHRPESDRGIEIEAISGGSNILLTYTPAIDKNWHWVTIVKKANIVAIYIDGIQKSYATFSSTVNVPESLYIGAYKGNSGIISSYLFNGYMDEIRIYDGNPHNADPNSSKTDTITIQTSEFSSDSNTKLLINFNDNTNDQSSNHSVSNNSVTYPDHGPIVDDSGYCRNGALIGGAHIDTSIKKFGDASVGFDGSGDYIEIEDCSAWDIVGDSTSDYTIDFWVYFKEDKTSGLIAQSEGFDDLWRLYYSKNNGFQFVVNSGGSSIISTGFGGPTNVTINQWYHVALIKKGSEYAIYIDGNQINYTNDSSTDTFSAPLRIAQDGNGYSILNGNLDGIRIRKENIFNASPNSSKTDTITIPTSAPPAGDPNDTVLPISLSFTNLDGNANETYRVIGFIKSDASSASTLKMTFNDDTGNNYITRHIKGQSTSVSAATNTNSYIPVAYTSSNNSSSFDFIIISRDGIQNMILGYESDSVSGTTVDTAYLKACVWENASNSISSITFTPSASNGIGENSIIKLYKLQ